MKFKDNSNFFYCFWEILENEKKSGIRIRNRLKLVINWKLMKNLERNEEKPEEPRALNIFHCNESSNACKYFRFLPPKLRQLFYEKI